METNLRRCVRCTEYKREEEFNSEHVLPDAIGGTFKVNNLCEECNTLLNQKVDEPFVKSNFVLYYRRMFKLNETSRRGTMKGMGSVIDNDGNKRLIRERDGQLIAELVDKFDHKILPDGRVECILTIDVTKQNQADELIKARLAQLSKLYGQDFGTAYTIADVKTNTSEPITVKADVENSLLIKQCVKIAYEIACYVQPAYIDDPTAELLRNFLVEDSVIPEMRTHMDQNYKAKESRAVMRMNQLNLQLHQHAVLIENIQNEGVFMTVKIFNYIYPVKITNSCNLFPVDDFLLVNDIVTREVMSNPSITFRLVDVSIAPEAMSEDLVQKMNTHGVSYFEFQDETLKFYREDGSLRYANHLTLAAELVKKSLLGQLSSAEPIQLDVRVKKLCIRSVDGTLIPVVGLKVQPLLITHRMNNQTN